MSSSQPQVRHQMAVDSSDILWCGLTNKPYCKINPKHVHLNLPLATKNLNLFFRIHLSVEIESFYFNRLLAELIDYKHARSSSSAIDENHVRTIVSMRPLEIF